MINIYPLNPTSSFAIYPDEGRPATVTTASYQLLVTHSIDQDELQFDVTALNTPNNLSYMLVLQYYSGSSGGPTKTGQYTYKLLEGDTEPRIWGSTHIKFGELHKLWSNTNYLSGSRFIDDGRMYVHDGVDQPSFNNYTSSNENATYKIYYS